MRCKVAISVCCAGSAECVAASSWLMSASRWAELARIVPSVCKIAGVDSVGEINRRSLRRDRLLPLRAERGYSQTICPVVRNAAA